MKRCPECRRDYYDDTLMYCLDDGNALLEGPAVTETTIAFSGLPQTEAQTKPQLEDGDVTAILSLKVAKKVPQRKKVLVSIVILLTIAFIIGVAVVANRYYSPPIVQQILEPGDERSTPQLYWQMTESDQLTFIQDRAKHVQKLIGDEQTDLDQRALAAIKEQLDDYVEDKDSLSQRPFEEGLRAIYGRASQFAPVIIRSYEAQKVPTALGLYQAMVESEYHDCPDLGTDHRSRSPVGIFQFSRATAAKYGMTPADYCDVQKQSLAAARYTSDLISDFGSERSSWTLALLSFNQGGEHVRDLLRQLRARGVTERDFWTIYLNQSELQKPMSEEGNRYVPRFFAAAIIGETPSNFDLATPPLTTLRQ